MRPVSKSLSTLLLFIFLFGLLPIPSVFAQSNPEIDFSKTLDYLHSQFQDDGGFTGLSEGSDPGTTARALLAFQVIGVSPSDFISDTGQSPIDYLENNYAGYVFDDQHLLFPGNAGTILLGLSPFEAAPEELAEALLATLQPDGSFSTAAIKDWSSGAVTDLSQALAILGLVAHGDPVPVEAVQYLLAKQLEDGSWDNGFGSDLDTTGVVMVALLSSGQVSASDAAIQKTLALFRTSQLDNAAWKPAWDESELNVDTTGWITLALVTAGENLADWQKGGQSPRDALLTTVQPDGSIGTAFVNVYSTVEALLGFADSPLFPIADSVTTAEKTSSKAALVVTLPDGSSLLRCVEFEGETISGYDLLANSGLQLAAKYSPGMGNAVCGIEGQGCPTDNCFCKQPDYWSYWHFENGEWGYSAVGADVYEVSAGMVDGWAWGSLSPAQVTFDQVCGENAEVFLPAVSSDNAAPSVEPVPTDTIIPDQQTQETPAAGKNALAQYQIFAVIAGALVIIAIIFYLKKRKA